MIPLDRYEKWSPILDECARMYLREHEYQEYQSIPDSERLRQLKALLEKPVVNFSAVNEAYFRAKWAEVLGVAGPNEKPSLLEVASGDADMIPQMMARVCPNSRYLSANMNRILTARLREKTKDLPNAVDVIEEDAANIVKHLPAESVDIVAFQHAVNDVVQAILCEREGVDTIQADWMETLPEMITILQRETAHNTLEQHARKPFLCLLENLLRVMKNDGLMVMSHYMFQLDLDWGYPPGLWENFIPITREWIRELPGCREVFFEGFQPHWWMFIQKIHP
jgi:SAM-dependent methyltransferase